MRDHCGWRKRLCPEALWVLAGAAALALGVVIYALYRSRESVYFLALLKPAWTPRVILPPWLNILSDHAPSMVHVYAFSLLTAACIRPGPRRAAMACAIWFAIDVLFEGAQHPRVSPLFAQAVPDALAGVPFLENIGPHFRTSTFDPLDLLAIAIGAVAAYLTLARWARRTDRVHPG